MASAERNPEEKALFLSEEINRRAQRKNAISYPLQRHRDSALSAASAVQFSQG